jgi:hypothetical protein
VTFYKTKNETFFCPPHRYASVLLAKKKYGKNAIGSAASQKAPRRPGRFRVDKV